jgi:hypothetical protein
MEMDYGGRDHISYLVYVNNPQESWSLMPSLPPDILCCTTEPRQKSGTVLIFTRRFGLEDFIARTKKFIKGFRKSFDLAFLFFFNLKISSQTTKLQLS